MEAKFIIFSVFFFAFLTCGCKSKNILGKFLKDYTDYENKPTTLSFLDCQSRGSIIKIVKISKLPIIGNPVNFLEPLKDIQQRRTDILNVINLHCPPSIKTLLELQSIHFTQSIRWIFLSQETTFNTDREIMNKLPIRLDSKVILAQNSSLGLILKTVYKLKSELPVIIEDYGNWNVSHGLQVSHPKRFLHKSRMNLHGHPLTASIVITNNDTFEHLTDYRNRHIDSITKVNWVLTNYIFDIINATRQFRYQPGWGIKNKSTGMWDGMVGDLLYDRADLGGTSLFMTTERVPIIDYISMTVPTHAAFIFRPPPLSYVSNIFYLPYQDMVWVCGLILVGVCSVVFYVVWRTSLRMQKHYDPQDMPRFSDVLMNAIGAVTQQGLHKEVKVLPGQIASFFLFLAMVFFYASYTANIVALLQSTTSSISTLQNLLDSKLDFGVEDIVYNRYYFKTATESVRKALYETKIAPSGKKDKFIEKSLGVAKMRKGLFAFHVEVSAAYKLAEETFFEHEKCGLMEIRFLQVTDPWYAIRKYSPYKEMIKVNLFRLREYGIQEREVRKIYSKKPECASRTSNFDSVRLIDCHVIIMIILSGYALSILVFLLEKLVSIRQCATSTAICTL